MKRSRKLSLSLLGAAPVALTACGDGTKDLAYQTLDECIQDGKATAQACSTAYGEALRAHAARSPRFLDPNACEAEYGGCQRYQEGGSSFWMPMMAGFLAGRWSAHWGSSGRPYVYNYGDWAPRPLYRSRDDWGRGTWSSWGGGRTYSPGSDGGWGGGSRWGTTGGGSGRISTTTLSRGGFGGTSMARGGWGGGS